MAAQLHHICFKAIIFFPPPPSFSTLTVTMNVCKAVARTSLFPLHHKPPTKLVPLLSLHPVSPSSFGFNLKPYSTRARCIQSTLPSDNHPISSYTDESLPPPPPLDEEEINNDNVQELLLNEVDASRLMKMDRILKFDSSDHPFTPPKRWFPYIDRYNTGTATLNSDEVLEALDPYIMDTRKDKFKKLVKGRSYSVCLVVEGLSDFGNVSAVFRSADALGVQSVHVISRDSTKRYRNNRLVSMGAEKWLDIELWNSPQECFEVLKSRGYRIATTHLGIDTVSIYDMDWSCPTAIVVGNEHRGISDEALQLSDLHCSIPMNGMVESFNVSVAAGILMHHAVWDRTTRLGYHGDLTPEESHILLAEFNLRHRKNASSIVNEYAKRRIPSPESFSNIH